MTPQLDVSYEPLEFRAQYTRANTSIEKVREDLSVITTRGRLIVHNYTGGKVFLTSLREPWGFGTSTRTRGEFLESIKKAGAGLMKTVSYARWLSEAVIERG